MIGMVTSKEWVAEHFSDLIKLAILVGGFAYAIDSTLKNHTAAIADISATTKEVVSQQAVNGEASTRLLGSLNLLEFRMERAEEDVREVDSDLSAHTRDKTVHE